MGIVRDGKHVILSAVPGKIVVAELKNQAACINYRNCISGMFQYRNAFNAICVRNGNVLNNLSAHGWLGYPDSVLICWMDGSITCERYVSIPMQDVPGIRWAISGMGLLDLYAPEAEGYCRFKKDGKLYDYSDVFRKTNHTAIGVKDGVVYGFYLSNMTAVQVNAYVKKQGMEVAIMLDGGHVAAVNCDAVSDNASQKQHNIIQFVQEAEVCTKGEIDVHTVHVYSLKEEGNKEVSANFKVREFRCRDGSDAIFVSPELIEVLQKVRTHFGKAVTIRSAYRTPTHNEASNGVEDSQHLYGLAADITVKGVTPKKVAAYVETLMPNCGGIGIYGGFTHVDVRSKKARWNG